MTENEQMAADLKAWRQRVGMTAEKAAAALGVPPRTLEGIELRRGFRYPRMLALAMAMIEEGK